MNKLLLTLLLASAAVAHAAPAPTLIPFQGRLTDQAGTAYTDGQFTLIFNLYDQAVGGNVLWTETHQKVGVVSGMVNVFLGSINPALAGVDFSQTRHLGITIDADNNPNTPDPEMVPRQMIIPAFAAKNAEKLAGYDWSPIFGANNPSGTIPGSKLTPASITSAQLAAGAVLTPNIADGQITVAKLANTQIIGTDQLVDGSVTLAKLAAAVAQSLVPAGAVNPFAGTNTSTPPAGWLFCDGSAVSRSTYASLFSAIGTGYGSGDGTTTFNLPDYRWTFLRGYGPNITVAGTGTVTGNQATFTNHGFNRSGVKVRLNSGTLTGLSTGTDYWVIVVDANTLAFASTKANATAATPTRLAISGNNTSAIVQWEDPDAAARIAGTFGAMTSGIGSFQFDQFKSHSHSPNNGPYNVTGLYWRTDGSGGVGIAANQGQQATSAALTLANSGGNETRPINAYVNYIIKY